MSITENKAWKYGIGIFPVALLVSWLVFPFLSDGGASYAMKLIVLTLLIFGIVLSWAYGFIWIYEHRQEIPWPWIVGLSVLCALFSALAGTYIYLKRGTLVESLQRV